MSGRVGRVRPARLTDLAALGELSRLSSPAEGEDPERPVRSLGLPVSASNVSAFSLFRMPLGLFQPHDPLYVYEEDGRLAGMARVERDNPRDEWTIVELDAVDHGEAGDIRFRLVQHLLRDGSKRGATRFHVACADRGGNVELFMQAGFARYGEETILYRAPEEDWPALPIDRAAAASQIRPAGSMDALALSRLYAAVAPRPVARLEAYRLPDWERSGSHWRVPRSSLTPILRFADIEGFVQESRDRTDAELAGFVQVGVSRAEQAHYLRVLCRPDQDAGALIGHGLAVIGERSGEGAPRRGAGHRHAHGVLTAVRTYESPVDRRLEEAGFRPVAQVSLLIKETLVRVAEPVLVPATR